MVIFVRVRVPAYLCFFLSGFTGLLFEILWTRQITRETGGAAFAVSAVLAMFMAGLGLGAFAGGILADGYFRSRRGLLIAYGAAEAAAGLLALLVPAWLKLWHTPLTLAYARFQDGMMPFHAATLGAVACAVLPPAFAMGLGLPMLTRFCAAEQGVLGRHLGGLYSVNTFGAVFGALAAGFLFIPRYGLPWTAGIGVGTNLLIAAICAVAAQRIVHVFPALQKKIFADSDPSLRGAAYLALSLTAFSGFCAMAYEVLWVKLLTLTFGPTTHAFTVVLAAFIFGLAAGGGFFGGFADRLPHPLRWLIGMQSASGLAALAASQAMGNHLLFLQKVNFHFSDHFAALMAVKAAYVFALLFIPTFLFGASLPLAAKLWGRYRNALGATAGQVYLWNTAGATLGSLVAGFVLLPLLGKENSLRLLAVAQAVASLMIGTAAFFSSRAKFQQWPAFAVAAPALLTLALAPVWPRWPKEMLARVNAAFPDAQFASLSWFDSFRLKPVGPPGTLEYFGDGLEGFTAVWKSTDLVGNANFTLYLSGKADASSRGDMITQVLLAHFPLSVHPHPRDVMVLGLASGITAGEVLQYPVDRVDVLEINPKVIQAAAFFEHWNNNVLRDSRSRIILQDAKAHLKLSGRRYDVIISEPSNPWMAGLADLFTREFYQSAATALNPGGIMVQFLHSYRMDWETFRLAGRTFRSIFPNSILVRTLPDDRPLTGAAGDYLLVGFTGERPWSIPDLKGKNPAMGTSQNAEINDARVFYRMVAAENLDELFGSGPLHMADHPLLEFQAPRQLYHDGSRLIEAAIQSKARISERIRIEIDSQKADPVMRLQFAAYALSVFRPFPGMADLSGVTPEQRENHARAVQRFCAAEVVQDLSPFADDAEILKRCADYQRDARNRALEQRRLLD